MGGFRLERIQFGSWEQISELWYLIYSNKIDLEVNRRYAHRFLNFIYADFVGVPYVLGSDVRFLGVRVAVTCVKS
ncbi:hypothetical protein LEP1GSC038_0133 [Leptospira weilii str. 2006001855]|uniref:Uncharacterized protein n=1 Tax=Leptospira weilii str. 2006001855 TaxID=996804 RepID=M6FNS0_9LEPT|nr:hypothetical protein LEP1GSC038_0133 [Leptospira weilii str. 2006001855]